MPGKQYFAKLQAIKIALQGRCFPRVIPKFYSIMLMIHHWGNAFIPGQEVFTITLFHIKILFQFQIPFHLNLICFENWVFSDFLRGLQINIDAKIIYVKSYSAVIGKIWLKTPQKMPVLASWSKLSVESNAYIKLHKNEVFHQWFFSKCDLVTLTEEIPNGKLHSFFCAVLRYTLSQSPNYD